MGLSIEPREYQLYIVGRILKAKYEGKNVIVELDAGMGKRVISFLLTNYMSRDERLVFITPSRASVRDTYSFFKKMEDTGNLKGFKIGYIGIGVGSKYREYIVKNSNILFTTPITLSNILSKNPDLARFDYVIINEVDKAVKRVARIPHYDNIKEYLSHFQLVQPWPKLRNLLPRDACWIGLSGTLRDFQTMRVEDDVVFKRDLETIAEILFPEGKPVDVVSMDTIIKIPDTHKYLVRNMTIIRKIPVFDNEIKVVLDALTEEIGEVSRILASRYVKEDDEVDPTEKIERAISMLPSDDVYKIKFLRLALIRKFVTATIPEHFKRFLRRPSIQRLIRQKDPDFSLDKLGDESKKIVKAIEIAREWVKRGKKIVVLTSYIITANKIYEKLREEGIKSLMITGKTTRKGEILEEFKRINEGAVLVLTPVGERDLDLPDAELILVTDVINTVKTMYQRFKRGRRAFVGILFYKDTYEQNKVSRLISRIKDRYPWSIIIE